MVQFDKKVLLITGGTGSFGNAVLQRFLDTEIGEIRIFSRDENKQDAMRRKYNNSKLKFYLGDVRCIDSIRSVMEGVDFVFHAAALKQVPSCEFFPVEAVFTNVLGADNVMTAASEAGVKNVICLSTDKAAYPINAMGISKAMMEKIASAKSRNIKKDGTIICCTRYGNVMCSRGSVIPVFVEQIKAGKELTVTDPTMTRFIMNLNEAIDLVLYAFENAKSGDLVVQKAPACTIDTLVQALKDLFYAKNPVKIMGIRHGEKLYETLLTKEEASHALDMGNFYRVPSDKRELNYEQYLTRGNDNKSCLNEFNSNNTQILNVEQVKARLLETEYIKTELALMGIH